MLEILKILASFNLALRFKLFFLLFLMTLGFSYANNPLSDTINRKDELGKKQGYWVLFGEDRPNLGYEGDNKIEEGPYKDSRKNGLWRKYYKNESLKSEITYVENRPKGAYKTYYETGEVEEEGYWVNRRNTGEFKRYHRNGNLAQHFNFSDNGKRNGEQFYYHENGQLEVKVKVTEGKEEGLMQRFYANGEVKEEKVFSEGVLDTLTYKKYLPKEKIVEVKEEREVPLKKAVVIKEDKPNPAISIVPDGFNKLYNKNKQLSQDGYFKYGKLYDGKVYKYDSDGLLVKIEIYKKGIYIGDGVVED